MTCFSIHLWIYFFWSYLIQKPTYQYVPHIKLGWACKISLMLSISHTHTYSWGPDILSQGGWGMSKSRSIESIMQRSYFMMSQFTQEMCSVPHSLLGKPKCSPKLHISPFLKHNFLNCFRGGGGGGAYHPLDVGTEQHQQQVLHRNPSVICSKWIHNYFIIEKITLKTM